ncbi:MAG: hypothetical protein QTN59_17215 [Candidatus Electrothrix communis]|nr:MAG: hypothetical protein QTN59_17215 [Candidatus Electrothrix communis]
MKRSFLLFFSFFALCSAVYLLVFYSQNDKEPLGKITQEAVRLLHKRSLISTGKGLLNAPVTSRLASINPSRLPSLLIQGIEQQLLVSSRSIAPQELIPRHAMAVLELANAAATGKSFLDSGFGQTLNNIDWPAVLQGMQIKRRLRQPLEQNASGLLHLLTHPSFAQVFGKRLFLAQLPALPSLIRVEQRHPLQANLLIIMDPGQEDPETVLFALLDMLRGEQTTLKHAGFTIYALKSKNRQNLYIASVGGKIILSFAQQPIRKSIALFLDRLFQQRNDLLLNQEYTKMAKERPEKTDFFLYADLFRLKLHLKLLFAHFNSQSKKQESQEFINQPWAPGVRSMGFFHHTEKNTEQFKTIVRFFQDQLSPFQKHIYTTPPIRNQSFEEVPADLLLSFWCNWLEPRLWWQTTVAHGKQEELAKAARIAAWIKEQTDMSMDEFLGLFGKNFSIHVADISTAGFFPVPRLCLSIEILDRKKMDEFFQEIIGDLPVKRTMAGGVPITSLLAAQGMLQPSYAFFNGYLLLADSKEQIEDILLKKKTPLAEGKEFQTVDIKPEDPANLQFFARTPEVINALQELASWAGTMIAVRDRKTGAMSKLLVDQVLSPLLDSFKVYHAIGIRSATAPGELVIDGTVLRTTSRK